MQVTDFKCYRRYMKTRIELANPKRGHLTLLAKAAQCQAAYLSQVLKEKADLTPEQAASLVKFWNLQALEAEYFMNLVYLSRAGSRELKKLHQQRLEEILKAIGGLKDRFQEKFTMSDREYALYYSHWHWSLLHMAIFVPRLQKIKALSETFGIPSSQVKYILDHLTQFGLAQNLGADTYAPTEKSLHIGRDSPFRSISAALYYQQALNDQSFAAGDGIHYVALYAMSHEDVETLRRMTLEIIERSRELVLPSESQTLQAFMVSTFPAISS